MRATISFLTLAAMSLCLPACLPPPPGGSEASIFKRPNRYGWGSQGQAEQAPAPAQMTQTKKKAPSGNRFGHNSDSGNAPSTNTQQKKKPEADTPPPAEKKKEMADAGSSDSGSSNSGSSNSTTSKPPSNLNSYPYARPVPGKKDYVTLPGKDSSIGEIDVTGIKPGTPVEIDDPRAPGKKVYFRVP